jgi:hypothetical protein
MGKGASDVERPSIILGDSAHAQQPLLPREAWKTAVFARSNGQCVLCDQPAVDAHHLIERKLFPDGGYYLDNGVGLCASHHWDAEGCLVLPEELRSAAGITRTLLPPSAASDDHYDKWLNPIDRQGIRHIGPLFYEEACQKALQHSGTRSLYQHRVKYPRTPHLPWSPGAGSDDLRADTTTRFQGKEVIVTEKLDGESATLYTDGYHARSLSSGYHPSRTWVKALQSQLAYELPQGYRLCGENMAALHSLGYNSLPGYFMLFSVWDEQNNALSWDDTEEWAELLSIPTVPVIWRGVWDVEALNTAVDAYQSPYASTEIEGYVVRTVEGFSYSTFSDHIAKWVRPNHVQTGEAHWASRAVEYNGIARPSTSEPASS